MRLALAQEPPVLGIDAALARLRGLAGLAQAEGADALAVPEMWIGGYNIAPADTSANAGAEGKVTRALCDLSAETGLALVAGLAGEGRAKPRNLALAVAGGEVRARYAKTHLFGRLDADRFEPGPALSPVFDLCGVRVALAICYDIEFPELARHLALQGAELVIVPTANMAEYDSVPERLVPARAEENAIFVAYANLCGAEGGLTYGGLSVISAPDGRDMARAGRGAGLIMADLGPDLLAQYRARQSHLPDRRPELYLL